MSSNFITQKKNKNLKHRINTLIGISSELKFLVGFFYFSGWQELYLKLKENENIKLKLLVGLQVDKMLGDLVEFGAKTDSMSYDEQFSNFMKSMNHALNNNEMDNKEFYEQVDFFMKMLIDDRLIIRKTLNPNHSKLYIFTWDKVNQENMGKDGNFIIGSSNLTRSGLSTQEELNVEISDYGYESAESYFQEKWETAIPITEDIVRKETLINFVKKKTQVARVSPFEAYAFVLKNYIDLSNIKKIEPQVIKLIEKNGFKNYSYQIDAVEQALTILDKYNGVIIADVVGLGKSVIASLIGKSLGKKGIIICPPGLMGNKRDKTGWWGYLHSFELNNWEVESRGQLESLANNIKDETFEVVVIDEAHYFRNQDTADHEYINVICKNKKVILLTATPFNNSPMDFLSLINLFEIPKKSNLIFNGDLEGEFREINTKFKHLSYIKKYYNSSNADKVKKAEMYYQDKVDKNLPIDIKKTDEATKELSSKIRSVIHPVLIRRNRIDLKNDKQYSSEIHDFSVVKDPVELYYELTTTQSAFYDKIIGKYFSEFGDFNGAIYQPFTYEKAVVDDDNLDETENRQFQQQRNLYDFMRRLLVKRFESSFGAFEKSINRFIAVHQLVLDFIDSSGKFILDRKLMERITGLDDEQIEEALEDFQNNINPNRAKSKTIYEVNKFVHKDKFITDINADLELFISIKNELDSMKMVQDDPKRSAIYGRIKELLTQDKNRKIIIFSEYVDTVNHLDVYLKKQLGDKLLVCDGNVSKKLADDLESDFNAQTKKSMTNKYQVLLTSDKLAEGFNLNRAGAIVNYDIPWNPTKVIQRVGRINRIGEKVFDELHIYNFFPTEAGSNDVKVREIASQKMFLIHNVLGEDSKIFDVDEEPTASALFTRINTNYEEFEEVSITTKIRNLYAEICEKYPEVIEKISQLPPRIKSAKQYTEDNLLVLRKKALTLFYHQLTTDNKIIEITIEDLLHNIQCEFEEKRLELSPNFWENYEKVKRFTKHYKSNISDKSLTNKAIKHLKEAIRINTIDIDELNSFMADLIDDLKNYKTLSEHTIGRIARVSVKSPKNPQDISKFLDEVNKIRRLIGDKYLESVKSKVSSQEQEVIIAIENQK